MNRQQRLRMNPDSGPGIDISSLIDICFLLLIYFITTSVILPAERDLPIGVPRKGGDAVDFRVDPLLISIDARGQVFADDGFDKAPLDADVNVRDLPLLEARLAFYQQGARAAGEDGLVIIQADDEAKSQRVIDVLNALAGVGIEKVTFMDPETAE